MGTNDLEERYSFAPTSGIEAIDAELDHQRSEGFTYEKASSLPEGSISKAAACYAYAGSHQIKFGPEAVKFLTAPKEWPFAPEKFQCHDDPIITLAKAGAAIAAEIDRLMIQRHPKK